MRNIVISVSNNLLYDVLCLYLKSESSFRIFQEDRTGMLMLPGLSRNRGELPGQPHRLASVFLPLKLHR